MIRALLSKLAAMFRRKAIEDDLDAELSSHLEMLIEENQRRGMSQSDARYAAMRTLGGITRIKEDHRDHRGLPHLETLLADLKYGARTLRANPGFTIVATLTLALGIGVVTTVFTAYNAIALKPLPVADPNQVVRLERWFESGMQGDMQYGFSYPEYEYARARNDVFESLVAASWPQAVVADNSEKLHGQLVSANYWTGLGVPAQIGRTFLPDEDRVPNPVMIISDAFWERRFQRDPSIVGRVVKLNGIAFTVVGVAAREFSGTSVLPQTPDFWAPVSMQPQLMPGRDWLHTPADQQLQILARLKPGRSRAHAESETAVLIRQFATTFKEADPTTRVTLQRTALIGNTEDPRFQGSALAITLSVGMVLLIGCVNIANMLLARGAARQKEISVRLALGASRSRVIRQLLTESFLLSLIGGAAGLLLSIWTTKLLWIAVERFIRERIGADIVVGLDLSPDARVLAYALFLSLIAGLLFGLSPALQFSRPDLTSALKDEGAFGARWTRSRLRGILVAMQVTVSIVLLISAGLLMRGLNRAQLADPGFETQNIDLLYGDFGPDTAALQRRLRDRLATLPEIRNTAMGTMPMSGTWTTDINAGPQRGRTLAGYGSDTYFDLLGIPVLRGRHLTALEAERVASLAVVSESCARKFWPGQDPLGRHFELDMNGRGSFAEFEVIGVAKDVRFANLSRLDVARVYLAPRPGGWNIGLMVRTEGDPRRAMAAIRAAAGRVDPKLEAGLSILNLDSGLVELHRSFARISALFSAALAALALALAGAGIYGVMAYLVSQRTKEIGVRIALGARAEDVLLSVVVRGLRPVFTGLALGIAAAAALSALAHSTLVWPEASDFLYGVPFYDPATFLALPLFVLIIAALASAHPARRALRVDPTIALRYE
jgi:predicted permease